MYRDEIMAIAEAVLDAREKGVSQTRMDLNPPIGDLEHAVRVLYRIVKKVSGAEQVHFPEAMPAEPEVARVLVVDLVQAANERLLLLRNAAIEALSTSRVQYIRPRVPDGEDVPF